MTRSRLHIGVASIWGIAALAASLVFAAATYRSIAPVNDAWDYAQEARQVARGQGFTSLYTYPVHLGRDEAPPFPVRWRMPLYAVRAAIGLRMGFDLPRLFFLIAIQAHVAIVVLVFLLGAHFGGTRVGSIAAAAAIASPLLLDPYSVGLNQTPAAALALLAWLLLLRGGRVRSAALAALPAAAAWYLRGEAALMAPLWIWAAWSRGDAEEGARSGAGARRGAAFALVLAALCLPWPIYLHATTGAASSIQGNPMLLYTAEYPGYASTRAYGEALPGILGYVVHHPLHFAFRWLKDVAGFGVDFLAGIGPIAVGLAMAGLLLREPKNRYAPLRPALPLVAAIALQIVAFAALERSPRFLAPVAPLACVLIGIAATPSLDRFCGRRMVALLFALLIGERLVTVAFDARAAARLFPPLPPATAPALAARIAAERPDSSALVLSDVPDWVAWHLDRPALLLPLSRDLGAVVRDHAVAGIFLSPQARARNAVDGDSAWVDWIDRRDAVPGFSDPEPLPGGTRYYPRRAAPPPDARR
ncbi:MAG TPA: hypothetical protein VF363_06670 [Candidatus Eisenbacteria bacterium]